MAEGKVTTLIDMEGTPVAPRTVASAVITSNGKNVEESLEDKANKTDSMFHLLWTNPIEFTTGATYAAQTVEVDLTGYTYAAINYAFSSNATERDFRNFAITKIGTGTNLFVVGTSNYGWRRATITETQVVFTAATYGGSGSKNVYCWPLEIYGIK